MRSMSDPTKKLDLHLEGVKEIIEGVKVLEDQKAELGARCLALEARVAEQDKKLANSRKTKKTLHRIETLESEVSDLTRRNDLLETELERGRFRIENATMISFRLHHIAETLNVKVGNRTEASLLAAIEKVIQGRVRRR